MEKKLKITVITVVYNGIDYIEDTILSVINQDYSNIEYIIIDGKSDDGTMDIVEKYATKISYWVSESDNGIYDAMNKGIKVATGDWIIFMKDGEIINQNTPAKVINELKNKVQEITVEEIELDKYIKKHNVISLKRHDDKIIVRILANKKIGTFCKPKLEDIYMLYYDESNV